MAQLLPDAIAELQQLLINWRNAAQQLVIIQKNLQAVNSATILQRIPVSEGTLFKIAAQKLGDPGKWRLIADANNLGADPRIRSFINLIIPVVANTSVT